MPIASNSKMKSDLRMARDLPACLLKMSWPELADLATVCEYTLDPTTRAKHPAVE